MKSRADGCARKAVRKRPSVCRHRRWKYSRIRRCRAPRNQSRTCRAKVLRGGFLPLIHNRSSSRRPSELGIFDRRQLQNGQKEPPRPCRVFFLIIHKHICYTDTYNNYAFSAGRSRRNT